MINIKSAIASNTSNIHHYKSTKREILNCNANIFINQKRIKSDLIIKHKLVVSYDIQTLLYNNCVVIDRCITRSLITVFHLDIIIICQFRVITVISYVFWSLHSRCLQDFCKLFWTCPKICLSASLKKLSSTKKQNLQLGTTTLLKCQLLGFPSYKMSD